MVEPIQEHTKIRCDSYKYQSIWKEGMRLPAQKKGLERWFFQWQWRNPVSTFNEDDTNQPNIELCEDESGYYASYVIGAQWFDQQNNIPVVITTKYGCDRVDFLKMFDVCFNSGIEAEEFSRIYDIDIDQPYIKAPEFNSVLSPLIIAHFLTVIQEIFKHGLKKDYVEREDNLRKVKGRIDVFQNEKNNIIKRRYDKVYCRYEEFSENTPENRLIKKALIFSKQILYSSSIELTPAGEP